MPNETPLPPEIAQIDAKIQSLRLLKQGLDAANLIKSKLGETADVMGKMSGDLKGETLTFQDFLNADVNEQTGELEFSLDTSKVDPLQLDKTELPANLVAEAIRAQTALEEIMNPFGEHNSKLLESMEKLSKGLDKSSEMFANAQSTIQRLETAIDMFERAKNGEISGDELGIVERADFTTVFVRQMTAECPFKLFKELQEPLGNALMPGLLGALDVLVERLALQLVQAHRAGRSARCE